MSKRYTPEFKKLVMRLLRDNHDDVVRVARYVGIPQRTLRDWQQEARLRAAASRASAVIAELQKRQTPRS